MAKNILPKLLVLESISGRLRKLISLRAKRADLGFPKLTETSHESHSSSLACRKLLVGSLIKVKALSTSKHSSSVRISSRGGR